MKEGLQEINDLIGSWGSLVINNQGEIIASATPPGLNKADLENISDHVVELFMSAEATVNGLAEVVLHFERKILFIHDLGQAILVVVCIPRADISLLRMTANVVVTTWQNDPNVQKVLKDNFVERV